jgi:D-serine deaminase-like pyridoxal phosphate-dependent protein
MNMIFPTLDSLETPAAVVDVDRVRENLQRTARYCREHNLAWRPHTKTHKTRELATEQRRAGAVGLTVATLQEAEVMADAGDDLLLAYPVVGSAKLDRLLSVPSQHITVGLDSRDILRPLARAAREAGREVGVLIELDGGMRRVGVQTPAEAVSLARLADELGGISYRGVMFYPGHIRARASEQGPTMDALSERLARFLEALEAADLKPEIVSGGSTPTRERSHQVRGLTEIRPGIDIFNDRNTAFLDACAWEDIAYSVLATVVSTAIPGQVVIDAGSKVLAKEEALPGCAGYGALLDRPEVTVHALSEEHGLIDVSKTDLRLRIGDRVRVVPNHVCVSVNLHPQLHAVRGNQVVGTWEVARR